MFVCPCVCACPSIFASRAQTAAPIRTGKVPPSDVPERRKDDGADRGAVSATWQVSRAITKNPAIIIRKRLRGKLLDGHDSDLVG